MRFEDVIGNDQLKEQLRQMVEANRLGHAVMFSEEDCGGAFPLAVALAQAVNCKERSGLDACGVCPSCNKFSKLIHPDLHFVFPVSTTSALSESEKKTPMSDFFLQPFKSLAIENPYFGEQELYDAIGIESKSGGINVHEARKIAEKLSLCSLEADFKTMIIYLPEKMNGDAANKLLKLIEEPPAGTLFILITHNLERVLLTIRSRCQVFHLKPLSRQERMNLPEANVDNEEYAALVEEMLDAGMSKDVVRTFPIWEAVAEKGREKQKEFCIYAENYIRAIFLISKGLDSLVAIPSQREEKARAYASLIKAPFYPKAFAALEGAIDAIESNGNAKLVFCDLCNRLLLSL